MKGVKGEEDPEEEGRVHNLSENPCGAGRDFRSQEARV